jgi:hypothetical protein
MPAVERKTEHVKILQDLGHDPWEIENDDDMLSALKASINDLSRENPSDGRIPMLQAAVKGLRKPKFKEKKTTIKGDKFMGKETKKDAPITDKSKLLPGVGKFNADDIKSDDKSEQSEENDSKVDKIIQFLNGEVKDKLDDINSSVKEIEGVIQTQGDLAAERDEDMRVALLAANKKRREDKLEGDDKKKGLKDKLLGEVTKPVGNFLNKLIKFVTMVFVGSVVNRVLTLLKDPAQLLDPIKQFFNVVIGLVNAVMKGLWQITGAPMNWIIGGINDGVKFLLDNINKATGMLKIPPIEAPQIPLIPGPPEFEFIPLSKTAQEKNAAVGMAEGGVVPAMDGVDGVDGVDGALGAPGIVGVGLDGADGLEGLPGLDGGGGGTNAITDKAQTKSVGARTKDVGNLLARPFRKKEDRLNADPRSQFATGFGGGGYAAPYPTDNLLGMGHNVINIAPNNIMGYNKGGKVPGSGTGDIVPAMLTPGEFVMSKGAVDQIGVDNLKEMNAKGGGNNQPKMMKFAGGGIVPGIDAPTKPGGNVVVLGGGGSSAPRGAGSSGSSAERNLNFSSSDPNNINVSVIKSIYNIMN